VAYAVALRLRRSGSSDADIADALGIDVDSVPHLIVLGLEKLQRIIATSTDD
jgi:DNA-directed RNA polymerase specialized sigma24 family protein